MRFSRTFKCQQICYGKFKPKEIYSKVQSLTPYDINSRTYRLLPQYFKISLMIYLRTLLLRLDTEQASTMVRTVLMEQYMQQIPNSIFTTTQGVVVYNKPRYRNYQGCAKSKNTCRRSRTKLLSLLQIDSSNFKQSKNSSIFTIKQEFDQTRVHQDPRELESIWFQVSYNILTQLNQWLRHLFIHRLGTFLSFDEIWEMGITII